MRREIEESITSKVELKLTSKIAPYYPASVIVQEWRCQGNIKDFLPKHK